jgi:hypothetical protein
MKEVVVKDDLNGQPGASTYVLSFTGLGVVEIDLADESLAKLQKALAPYFDKGREKGKNGTALPYDSAEVREWANANGHEVSPKGRMSADVVEAYNKAHGK